MIFILCITTGGVYAGWSYAAKAGVKETVNKGVSITTATQEGSLGEYKVLYDDFSLVIDQTATGDYTPILRINKSENTDGNLYFKFTPTDLASDDLKANGMESTVTFSSTLAHDGTAIFAFPKTLSIGRADDTNAEFKWEKQADNTFLCTIPNDKISEYIQLNYTTKLDTFEKYTAFEDSLDDGTVSILIANAAAMSGT